MLPWETVFDSVPQFLVACLVLALAQVVYVLLGFGAGLIAVGLLAMILPGLHDTVVLLALVNLPTEIAVVRSSWRQVSWRGVPWILAGVAVGIPLGTGILRGGEPRFLLGTLGLVLAVVGVAFLVAPPAPRAAAPRWLAAPVGLTSGVLTGLFGTGGPPLVLYFQLGVVGKAAFRGSLMTLFLAMTVVRLPAYVAAGLVTGPRLTSAVLVLPAVLAGAWLGHRIHVRVAEVTFRRLVSGALLGIGLLLLLQAV